MTDRHRCEKHYHNFEFYGKDSILDKRYGATGNGKGPGRGNMSIFDQGNNDNSGGKGNNRGSARGSAKVVERGNGRGTRRGNGRGIGTGPGRGAANANALFRTKRRFQ
ncbi:hypothetical protein JCGZ_10560 [Jatropha curcas]|uniref:Uncharacterized protein n=1 Tax=Jatropha curcas TaxID=180498 RepID=A0A067KR85_JATCU|nr:hypothetical protein JCGZ_10560 [Jatropha curcas]